MEIILLVLVFGLINLYVMRRNYLKRNYLLSMFNFFAFGFCLGVAFSMFLREVL